MVQNTSQLKAKVIEKCVDVFAQKIDIVQKEIASLQQSVQNEAKSSAGDKHETTRAHIHLELEKLGSQLNELNKAQNTFKQATNTSLIETDKAFFFIAASLGKIMLNGIEIMVISHASPLAKILLAAKAGAELSFNNVSYRIISVS